MTKEKIEYFENLQKEIQALDVALKNKLNQYKAEMKKEVGVCDGEQTDVLSLVKLVTRLSEVKQ